MCSLRFMLLGLAAAVMAAVLSAPAIGATSGGSSAAAPLSGSQASSGSQPAGPASGGAGVGPGPQAPSTPLHPVVQGFTARVIHGVAYAPSYAPLAVKRAIWAGDRIRHKPYIYGGGHGAWISSGYDCSGSVSYVLHAAGLLMTSMDSSGFESWGQRGIGQWITVYTNPAHAFVEVAGIRFDTSAEDDPHPPPGSGPRWRPVMHRTASYLARHPAGL
jgi:hypothetical protein